MEFRPNKRIKLSSQKGPSPLDLARTYCQNYVDPPGFEVKTVNDVIGEGVFATKPFKKGDFLLEYKGDLITRVKHARQLEKEYEKEGQGSFMYFFKYRDKSCCIDATNDIFHEGRMINDAENGDAKQNCVMKIVEVNQTPHLCTFADRDIAIGEELRYDYGVPTLPWRKKCTKQKMGNPMTTRSTDSQEPGQTTSIHREEVNETKCTEQKKGNTMTTRPTDSQEPGQTTSVHTEEVNETKCTEQKKGNTMTTRSTDSQEPGQTTSVHTEEVDETKRVLQIPGEQNKQPKSNGVKTKKELFTDT
ncbi:uncharacterized protein LOC127858807 isoform X6 [Dreissena polymorpha]|uniref:uncharacterized protein LOC127857003 isoform X2 n=1 Tax=Dreissena polymorpha TaxID=45954 RepID=UPI0022655E55|nr:uncharacterized protein LOC127857003 isoform X2 [Dreissena polymorpha]XP_052252056.1 uncharacterized protein LOC127858807 isoform X6 [Dreissena polymorpha]